MTSDLVTIARLPSAQEAELLRGALRLHGIESIVVNAQMGEQQPFPAAGWANVMVQVRSDDATAAARVVEEHDAAARRSQSAPATTQEQCLACGAAIPASASSCPACGWTWLTNDAAG